MPKKKKAPKVVSGPPLPKTQDAAISDLAAKYGPGEPAAKRTPLREVSKGTYEQDFGSVDAIVEREARRRRARDERDGVC